MGTLYKNWQKYPQNKCNDNKFQGGIQGFMINTMTVEEKLRLICAKDFWHTVDFDGKIPYVTVADGPLGLRRANGECWEGHIPGISYPSMNVVGNSWNREISRKMGESIADD